MTGSKVWWEKSEGNQWELKHEVYPEPEDEAVVQQVLNRLAGWPRPNTMSGLRIYIKVLSPAQVHAIYNSERGLYNV